MGFFSWITADDGESIANEHSHRFDNRRLYFIRPNQKPVSGFYDGYGRLVRKPMAMLNDVERLARLRGEDGPISIFALFAEMNEGRFDPSQFEGWSAHDVGAWLSINFEGFDLLPIKLSYNKNAKYHELGESIACPFQGYFY